ncbi:hypothetical protein AVS7_03807 [Acidovorax sp. MR-S7]|nr:hypothetical protein AVS7_03807 [Acidovorax sp. MR-S7]
MVSGWGAMACRANKRKGWGGVKTCPVRRLDRSVPLAFLNIQKKGDGVGGIKSLQPQASRHPAVPHAQKITPR